MRWDNLRIDSTAADREQGEALKAQGTLPLIERDAVVRTFDTPGFRGMTFYEVQAKSIVSRGAMGERGLPARLLVRHGPGRWHPAQWKLPEPAR